MLLSRFWFIIALVLLLILAGCQIKTPSHSIRPPLGQEAPASHLGRVFMTSDGLPPRERRKDCGKHRRNSSYFQFARRLCLPAETGVKPPNS